VLRRKFVPKRDQGQRNQHNEGLGNFYFSSGIVGMFKSRRMKWAELAISVDFYKSYS
jgi:hypothetical protein